MNYRIYNTIIESEIKLLNLPEYSGDVSPSVSIYLKDTPSSYIPKGVYGTYYSPNASAMGTFFGTFEVIDGSIINVHIYEGSTEADIAQYLIGWAFAFLFTQRGDTVIHCSALNINDHGVIVSGVSGAGKSTTALSLINKGARYLADDIAVFSDNDISMIIPAFPVQKVCRDVSSNIESNNLVQINEGRGKFAYYNKDDFCDTSVKATHLILLNIHDGDEVKIKEYTGLDKWMQVLSCLFLNDMYVTFGTPDKDKFHCLKLAEATRVIEISRPKGRDTLSEITDKIIEIVNQ